MLNGLNCSIKRYRQVDWIKSNTQPFVADEKDTSLQRLTQSSSERIGKGFLS
jgi:hypothetical protein